MITYQKLIFGNAFSYGAPIEIDFTANTVTQILGANGNGKSSIPLILEEISYNKNSKGVKKSDIPNRYVNDGYWMHLFWKVDDDQYETRVDRKTNIKVKLIKNGEDISSHTATATFKQIEEIHGFDFKMFSQLVYQNTNASLQFLVATDTNRKKFLIDLLQLEEYVKMFDVFKEAVAQHATDVSRIEGQISTVEKWLAQNSVASTELLPLVDVSPLEEYTQWEREAAKVAQEIAVIEDTNKRINANEHYKRLLNAINIEEVQAEPACEHKSYDKEQSELGGLTSEKKRITAYISKIEGLSDTCPTCEQSIEPEFKEGLIASEREALSTIEEKIASVTASIKSIKDNNTRYAHKQEKIKEWEELFGKINKGLESEPANKLDLEDELTNLTLRISNAKSKLAEARAQNAAAEKHNSRIEVFLEQSEKFRAELTEASGKLAEAKATLADLELLKKAFSTNGVVAYKIENLVKELEELANEYLAELSDGRFTIEFTVSSDKLNVIITDDGNIVDILALSSGELARVNTSTLLALRKLMNSISKSRINILFLDEVISVLDDSGKERLVEVLLKEELNTFLVSHSWTHPLLAKLEVVKEDNLSRIEYG